MEDRQVGMAKRIFAGYRCLSRIVPSPWAETAATLNVAGGLRIGEGRDEGQGPLGAGVMQRECFDIPYQWNFARLCGKRLQTRAIRHNIVDHEIRRLFLRGWPVVRVFFAARPYVNL